MSTLLLSLKPLEGGTFRYVAMGLSIAHRAIDTLAMVEAQTRAAEMVQAIQDGGEALALMGIEAAAAATSMGRTGLSNFFYHVELLASVQDGVTVGEGEAAQSGALSRETLYQLAVRDAAFFLAWQQYSSRTIASASEGNVFTPSPDGTSAGAQTSVEAASD